MNHFQRRLNEALDRPFKSGDQVVNIKPIYVYSWDLRTNRPTSYKMLKFREGLTFQVRNVEVRRDYHEGTDTYTMYLGEIAVPKGHGRFEMSGTYKWDTTEDPAEHFVRHEDYVR